MVTLGHLRRASVTLALLLLLPVGTAPSAFGQACTITDPGGARPSPRSDHAMAYLSNGRVLLFGGRDAFGQYLGDTWLFDGTSWSLAASTGPSPRARFGMTNANGVVVLQGGEGAGGALTDTWQWTGSAWQQVITGGTPMTAFTGFPFVAMDYTWQSSPCQPVYPSYCYEVWGVRAGYQQGVREWGPGYPGMGWGAPRLRGGTGQWYVDGSATTADLGSSSYGGAIAFGGRVGGFPLNNVTLSWFSPSDSAVIFGNAQQVAATFGGPLPGARADHAMAQGGTSWDEVILFGGSNGDPFTWRTTEIYNPSANLGSPDDGTVTWEVAATSGPGARMDHAMAYDPQRGRTILFGGQWNGETFGDTWEWNPVTSQWVQLSCACRAADWAQQAPPSLPSARSEYAMAYHASNARTVLFGGTYSGIDVLGETWEWDGTTWALRSTSGPSPRRGAAMAWDEARRTIVMFGGLDGADNRLSDTWEWDGIQWSLRSLSGPSPRFGAALAYFAPRQRVTLFGGDAAAGFQQDTWEWDGSSWSLRSAGGGIGTPGPRTGAAMAYDPFAQALALFGGNNGSAFLGGPFRWNGTSWSSVSINGAAARPVVRGGPSLQWSAERGKLVLFGGWADSGLLDDTWELDLAAAPFPWLPLPITGSPSTRRDAELAPGPGGGLVLFGGRGTGGALSSTWRFLGADVPRVTSVTPQQTRCTGPGFVELAVTSSGENLQYAWRKDGVPIPGANLSTFVVIPLTTAASGTYTAQVTSPCGTTTSPGMPVTVHPPLAITAQPVTQQVCPSGVVHFTVSAMGPPGLTYQWKRDSVAIPGATNSYYTKTNVQAPDAGLYSVEITSSCGTITSVLASLVVDCPPRWYRMNAGGPVVQSGDEGAAWYSDTPAVPSNYVNAAATGNSTSSVGTIIDTTHASVPPHTPMELFQTQRWDPAGGAEQTWEFPTGDGDFEVRLYFAETYAAITGPGQRTFGIEIEGQVVATGFDIFATAGGRDRGVVRTFNITVTGGSLKLRLLHEVENPTVAAVEVRRVATLRVNAGGPALPAAGAEPGWGGDTGAAPSRYVNAFATGNAVTSTSSFIDMGHPSVPPGTPMALFQDERWDPDGGSDMTWSLPVVPGRHRLRLYFAETYSGITAAGQRVFDVEVEGATVLSNFDVFALVGANRALVRTFYVDVPDSIMTVGFVHNVENPAIKALEVSASPVGLLDVESPVVEGRVLLAQNRPNPFREPTRISFMMPRAGHASLRVFDLAGRRVATLVDATIEAGAHESQWNGRNAAGAACAPGVYLYRLETPEGSVTRRMVLLH
ncbi:MAG: T9SS type A sorting domain-containing protein [Candidatus Eisenbacteria bacterium]|nr:T9SS type A sorting domain-containing protein [Candidatus Eisenbacteria bacterium]